MTCLALACALPCGCSFSPQKNLSYVGKPEPEELVSSKFSIGHIALGVALGYVDFRFPSLAWRNGHPKLAAWHKSFEARPSVMANAPVDEP